MTDTPDFTTGQWAYRGAPTVQVAVPITNRPGEFPVVSMDARGGLLTHSIDGRWGGLSMKSDLDLVPLETPTPAPAPLMELWANVYPDKTLGISRSAEDADKYADPDRIRCVHLREVVEGE